MLKNCSECANYAYCELRKISNIDKNLGCLDFRDKNENYITGVNNTLIHDWETMTNTKINGIAEDVISGEDFAKVIKKAKRSLEKMKDETIEFHGVNVIVNPMVGELVKGAKRTEESRDASLIKSITVNKKKLLVTVVFRDGCVEMIKCCNEDKKNFDVNIGVALAIAKHLYGSKNKFHKEVAKRTRKR